MSTFIIGWWILGREAGGGRPRIYSQTPLGRGEVGAQDTLGERGRGHVTEVLTIE